VRSLLEASSPAVLTTYRKDASAHTVPVWYRWTGEAFEVVIAKGDLSCATWPATHTASWSSLRPSAGSGA
jgi:hypothetical protein